MLSFDIHGKFKLRVTGKYNSSLENFLERELGYFKAEVSSPDMEVELVDSLPEPPYPLFPLYGKTDTLFYLRDRPNVGSKVTLDYQTSNKKILAEKDIDEVFLLYDIIEPFMFYRLLEEGFTFLHASAVSKENKALVFSAWPRTGKSNTLLSLLHDGGYYFLSDEWTLVSEQGLVYPYPRRIFGTDVLYHLDSLPSLPKYVCQNWVERQKMQVKRLISRVDERLGFEASKNRFLLGIHLILASIGRLTFRIAPRDIGEIGDVSRMEKLFMLLTDFDSDQVKVAEIKDKESLAIRLSANLLSDYRDVFTHHYLAYLFGFPEKRNPLVENALNLQAQIITKALKDVACYQVMIPGRLPFREFLDEFRKYM